MTERYGRSRVWPSPGAFQCAVGGQPGRKPLALFVVGFDISRNKIGRGEIGFQAVKDRALDRIA